MNRVLQLLHKYTNFKMDMLGMYVFIFIKAVLIIVLGKIIISVLNKVINNIVRFYPKLKVDERKTGTLTGLLKSVVRYTVYIIMGISVLDTIGIPTQPLLATAGLGGIAIGFGAQSMVKDVFTGFLILFEDQYSVGDFITIDGITGTVEDMGLRITKIRSFKGELHIIPNGEVKIVTNLSRGNALAIVDVGIAYEEDEERAMIVMGEAVEKFYNENVDKLAASPEVLGIVNFGESDVVLRAIVKTLPLMHWSVERGLRKAILEGFKKNNVEIPYPRRVMIKGE